MAEAGVINSNAFSLVTKRMIKQGLIHQTSDGKYYNMMQIKYGTTNTFFISGLKGGLLIDTDYCGSLPLFYYFKISYVEPLVIDSPLKEYLRLADVERRY